jgi:hypothetical protein
MAEGRRASSEAGLRHRDPWHGLVSTRKDLEAYHDKTIRFRDTLAQLVKQGKSKADIEAVVRGQFDWEDFHVQSALDGVINEFR